MQSKAQFIRNLQSEDQVIHSGELSQRIRIEYGLLSLHMADNDLDPSHYRGYMTAPEGSGMGTADSPHYCWCILATKQSLGWSNVTWIKEMLQMIDSEGQKTKTKKQLKAILEFRRTDTPNGDETPENVIADKNGFILALGCAVPKAHRTSLRNTGVLESLGPDKLEGVLGVPSEYVKLLFSDEFELAFDNALSEIDC